MGAVRVVEEVRKYREHDRFLRGLVSSIGFRQEAVLFDRDARFAGRTWYPWKKMVRFSADGILGFSTVPLQMISRMGFVVSGVALLGILYALGVRLFIPSAAVPGWAFQTIATFFIASGPQKFWNIVKFRFALPPSRKSEIRCK